MTIEQLLSNQKEQQSPPPQAALSPILQDPFRAELPEAFSNFLYQSIGNRPVPKESVVLYRAHEIHSLDPGLSGSGKPPCIINLQRLNDIRYINKFMEAVNAKLTRGGWIIGCVETNGQRYRKIRSKYPQAIGRIVYFFDFLIHRVLPKLPYLRKLYFFLLKGRGRVLSEIETIGRLISCGYKLINAETVDEKFYFLAKKTCPPDFNCQASYDPVIKLKRIGKHGKRIKVLKFRTMYPYSEYLQDYIYETQGLQEGGKFYQDPRINSIGRFMRKYFLDELPMLINVLRGDLKLFGVRPLSKQYLKLYPSAFQAYRSQFKPGLIPPYYVDMPKSIYEIVNSEKRYLKAYEQHPWRTDFRYLVKALYNIIIKRARSS